MWFFLKMIFLELVDVFLVYICRCLYIDIFDGYFWIDNYLEIKGFFVSSGGSGYGFKMVFLLGEIVVDVVEEKLY